MAIPDTKTNLRRMAVLLVMATAAAAIGSTAAPAQQDCSPETLITERSSNEAIRCALRASQRAVEGRTISVVGADEEVPGVWFSINFEFDSARLTPGSRDLVERLAEVILEDEVLSEADLLIDGHTDAVGPAAYNLGLGERRANSVAVALVGYGIDDDAMRLRSFGETQLADPDHPAAAVNRRVEITPYVD